MLKYRITNVSQTSAKGARNVFLTEVGKLLKPGDQCISNRIDTGTQAMVEAGVLKVEEGSFAKPPLFAETSKAPPPPAPAKKQAAAEPPPPPPKPEPKPVPKLSFKPEPKTEDRIDSVAAASDSPVTGTKKDKKSKASSKASSKSFSTTKSGGKS